MKEGPREVLLGFELFKIVSKYLGKGNEQRNGKD